MVLAIASHPFSQLSISEILAQMKENGITAIEWCDCHLPVGDLTAAEDLHRQMSEAEIHTLAYRVNQSHEGTPDESIDAMIATAKALGTDCINFFYDKNLFPKEELSARPPLIEAAQHMADKAKAANMRLCFSSRGQSLFRDYLAVTEFMQTLNRDNVLIHWQPNGVSSLIYNIFELKMLSPFIGAVYVALCDSPEEQPQLIEGQDEWQQYLKILKNSASEYIILQNPRLAELADDCIMMRDWMAKTEVN